MDSARWEMERFSPQLQNLGAADPEPLARSHFQLFWSFGLRLLFAVSIPTFRNDFVLPHNSGLPAISQ